jgi:hypothetical protein
VVLCKKNIKKNRYVHQLVAKTFLERPPGKKYVKHKDGNKTNNNVKNLKWY